MKYCLASQSALRDFIKSQNSTAKGALLIPSLTASLETILSSGGDTRLDIDARSGRNRYECLPRPGDVIPFGSCTSSTVSPRGYRAAQSTQRQICSAPDSTTAANECATDIRRRLHDLLTLPPGVEIALAPSGTDVEMLAAALVAGDERRPVVNVVVGPSEVGSGTPLAAACCHYDRLTPNGRTVVPGEPVDDELASSIDVRTVDLRTLSGNMLMESEIDTAAIELVVEALEADAKVLLHVVAHSKTGVHAPSLACVARLRQISDDVIVVVDAAQGRFSRRGLREVLQKNYLVMFTGSKFYGGPPFSGALLIPEAFHPRKRGLTALPAGFCDYFTAAEMPESWREIRSQLPAEPNFGTILRWTAAIAEIEAYYSVSGDARLRILRFFESEVPRIFGESNSIRMLSVFPPLYDDFSERLLESKTTVFGFWVEPLGQSPLTKLELKQLHAELASDLSLGCQEAERAVMSRQFHLGQPVDLGAAGSILRVALGGEMVTRLATDENLGSSLDERLAWFYDALTGLRRKLECLVDRSAPTRGPHPAVDNRSNFAHA